MKDKLMEVNEGISEASCSSEEFIDPQSFSLWVSNKVGKKNDTLGSIAYIFSTFAVMEIAQNVLCLGSGFGKLDMNALTMNQIRESTKRIEEKLEVILGTPLKEAKKYFNSAIKMIEQREYEEAYETIKNFVIPRATTAFYYAARKNISSDEFEACLGAARILIFSVLLRFSYDKIEKMFLPFQSIPPNKKELIRDELEKIVNDCIEQEKNVQISFAFMRKEKKNKVQDILDDILKIAYPYISNLVILCSQRLDMSGLETEHF